MSTFEIFYWGFCGSIAVEIATVVRYLQIAPHRLPRFYSWWGFYVARVLLAFVAGALAIAYQIDKPLLALNIGAATPLIVRALGKDNSHHNST